MEDTADIFDSSLSALFQVPPIGFSTADPSLPHTYTPPSGSPVKLWLPQPPANVYAALQANNLWLAAVYLADLICTGEVKFTSADGAGARASVVELGAASGLPGIMAAKAGALVVGTDYDDDTIISVMRKNYVEALGEEGEIRAESSGTDGSGTAPALEVGNATEGSSRREGSTEGHWAVRGHSWGTDPAPLLATSPSGFDSAILADTLWATAGHGALLDSVWALLKTGGVAHVAAGLHTGRGPVHRFVEMAKTRGFAVEFVREVAWQIGGGWGESHDSGQEQGEERGIVVYYLLRK